MTREQALDVLRTVAATDAALRGESPNLNRITWLVSEAAAGRIWTGDSWHHAQRGTIVTEAYATGIAATDILAAL
jgi:hypothetical protein